MKDLKLVLKAENFINDFILIAGPCSVESEQQLLEIANFLKKKNIKYLRGGAFKPRTSPYSFQGHGEEALKILKKVSEKTGLKTVTEVLDVRDIHLINKYADIFQVGTRNSQNFSLLKELGKTSKPIILKRGFAQTVEEFLYSAEYILKEGNKEVILCERGIRTFETQTRNTLDISAVPVIKKLTKLPIIIDPSHAAGRKDIIIDLSKAAIAVGSDGLLIEVHNNPEKALSDNNQQLDFNEFSNLLKEIKPYLDLQIKKDK
ncbi:3-deoxy-7-phosphoheptulonate synthase [Candidatus Woesearchaeota archaeon]|nr:3-deoxy-7-phosphoheptulonate synthase [Candidatus Woesearchaeota archaeon]